MANRSTAPGRIALMGLVVAGALAGTAATAGAQYYYYDDGYDPYPSYGYGYRYDYGYAPRPPVAIPRAAPAPASLYEINRIAARDYGLVRIERSIRRDDAYVVDGETASGQRLRLILDAYAGDLIRRVPLRSRSAAPHIVRADPRQDQVAPHSRLVPQPPERPAELKPPAEASAPATPSPPSSAKPAEPSPGATNPETGADKPGLVEPGNSPAEAQKTGDGAKPAQSAASPVPEAQPAPAAQPAAPAAAAMPDAPRTEPPRPGTWIPPFPPSE